MKLKLLIITLALLLVNGCYAGSTPPKELIADTPAGNNPGNENPDANNPDEGTQTPAPKEVLGWYMRTVAKATASDGTVYTHDSAGVFGELKESQEGKDRHDIGSYGKATFQIRFINDHIETGNEYYSDYRNYDGNAKKEVWTFVVKNERVDPAPVNLANADLSLSVKGIYNVYEAKDTSYEEKLSKNNSRKTSLTLIDVDNQRTYSYDELKTANLNMDGLHKRTFKWVLGDVDNADMEAQSKVQLQSKSTSTVATQSIAAAFAQAKSAATSKFGTPPE